MYDLKILRTETQEILDISSLQEQNKDLLSEIVDQLLLKWICVQDTYSQYTFDDSLK